MILFRNLSKLTSPSSWRLLRSVPKVAISPSDWTQITAWIRPSFASLCPSHCVIVNVLLLSFTKDLTLSLWVEPETAARRQLLFVGKTTSYQWLIRDYYFFDSLQQVWGKLGSESVRKRIAIAGSDYLRPAFALILLCWWWHYYLQTRANQKSTVTNFILQDLAHIVIRA